MLWAGAPEALLLLVEKSVWVECVMITPTKQCDTNATNSLTKVNCHISPRLNIYPLHDAIRMESPPWEISAAAKIPNPLNEIDS